MGLGYPGQWLESKFSENNLVILKKVGGQWPSKNPFVGSPDSINVQVVNSTAV